MVEREGGYVSHKAEDCVGRLNGAHRQALGKKGNYVRHAFGTSLLIRVTSVAYSSDILVALEHCMNHQIIATLYRDYTFAHMALFLIKA